MKIENNLNKLKDKKSNSGFYAFIVIIFLIVFFTARYATSEDFRTLSVVNILKKDIIKAKTRCYLSFFIILIFLPKQKLHCLGDFTPTNFDF